MANVVNYAYCLKFANQNCREEMWEKRLFKKTIFNFNKLHL